MTIDVLSIGIKFENFMQAGCKDLGLHRGRTVYCRKPIILPNLVLFLGTFLELQVLPSIICAYLTLSTYLSFSIETYSSYLLYKLSWYRVHDWIPKNRREILIITMFLCVMTMSLDHSTRKLTLICKF